MNINKIIQQLQPIKVELEFDGNKGIYVHCGKEIEGDGFLIRLDLWVFQRIEIEMPTILHPAQETVISQTITVEGIYLWLNGSLEKLSDKDYNKLMKGIIKTIEL